MIDYLVGSREEFWNFVEGILEKDKIALITHTDLDGLASGIFLEEIFEKKLNKKFESIDFIDYGKEMLKGFLEKFKDKGITKVFLSDLNVDSSSFKDFLDLRENFDVFLIDHHPSENGVNKLNNVIKTNSADCSSMTIYELGKKEGLINDKEWRDLLEASIVADMSFKGKEGLRILRERNYDFNEENIRDFKITLFSHELGAGLVYYKSKGKDLKLVFDLIKKRDFSKFKEMYGEIEEDVQKFLRLADKEAEFFPENNLYFYYLNPEFNIASVVSTLFSDREGFRDKAIVFVHPSFSKNSKNFLKISARNQDGNIPVNILLQRAVKGLEKAIAGGHAKAAGGTILKKDLEKFKKELLRSD